MVKYGLRVIMVMVEPKGWNARIVSSELERALLRQREMMSHLTLNPNPNMMDPTTAPKIINRLQIIPPARPLLCARHADNDVSF